MTVLGLGSALASLGLLGLVASVGEVDSVSLAGLAAGAVVVPWLRSPSAFRGFVSVQVLLLGLVLAGEPLWGWNESSVLAVPVLELCLYEAFPRNLVLSLGLMVVALAVAAVVHGPMSFAMDGIATVFFVGLIAVVASLLVRYREHFLSSGARLQTLEGVVERLTRANLGYQTYADEAAVRSKRQERLRITRELHDVVGYTFTSNIMMMEAAMTKIQRDPSRVSFLIDLARKNAELGYAKIRESLYLMRSDSDEPGTSVGRFRNLVSVFAVATGIQVTLDYGAFPEQLPAREEDFFYPFLQESLTNAFLHGAADRIDVRLFRTERGFCASVSDNGRGGAPSAEGIGLGGMRERLQALGGSLEIRDLGAGWELLAEVPHG